MLDQTLSAVDPQGHDASVSGDVLIGGTDIGPGDDGRDVGAHGLGGGEGEGVGIP